MQTKFLVIGRGRLAKHLGAYLQSKRLPFEQWSRNLPSDLLNQSLLSCTHLLLCISDDAIQSFVDDLHVRLRNLNLREDESRCAKVHPRVVAHFSGSRSFSAPKHESDATSRSSLELMKVFAAHPLMTFSNQPMSFDEYKSIPFILETEDGVELSEILPGIDNPSFKIARANKSLYHALCVLTGNGTVVTWQAAAQVLRTKLDLPAGALEPYFHQISRNVSLALRDELPLKEVLSGPWLRGDLTTENLNLSALASHYAELAKVYASLADLAHANLGSDGRVLKTRSRNEIHS